MIKAILFDVDGTLLDSWNFIFDALKYATLVHGYKYPQNKDIRKALGKPILEFYQILYPRGNHARLKATHLEYQASKFDTVTPFPNVRQTLQNLKGKNVSMAAISNRTRKSLLTSLKKAKILQFIDIVVSAEDVTKPKPHMEHIMVALKYLKAKPENSLIVGDTNEDILAGKNTKIKTVGVTYGFLGHEIKKYKPDYVINKIEELLKIIQ